MLRSIFLVIVMRCDYGWEDLFNIGCKDVSRCPEGLYCIVAMYLIHRMA